MESWTRIFAVFVALMSVGNSQDFISELLNDGSSSSEYSSSEVQQSSPPIDKRMDLLNFFLSGRGNSDDNDQEQMATAKRLEDALQTQAQEPSFQIQQPKPNQVMLVREATFPNPNGGLLSRLFLYRRERRLRRWARRFQLLPLLFGLRQVQLNPLQTSQSQNQVQQAIPNDSQQQTSPAAVLLLANRNGEIIPNYNPSDVMNRPLIFANNDVNQKQLNGQSLKKQQYVQHGLYDDDDSTQENSGAIGYGSTPRQYPQSHAASKQTPQDNRDYNNIYTEDDTEKQRKYNNEKISSEYDNTRVNNRPLTQKYAVIPTAENDGNIRLLSGNQQGYYSGGATQQQDYGNQQLIMQPPITYSQNRQNEDYNIPLILGGNSDGASGNEGSYKQGLSQQEETLLLRAIQQQQQQQQQQEELRVKKEQGSNDDLAKTGSGSPVVFEATLPLKSGVSPLLAAGKFPTKPVLNVNGKVFFGAELGKNAGVATR